MKEKQYAKQGLEKTLDCTCVDREHSHATGSHRVMAWPDEVGGIRRRMKNSESRLKCCLTTGDLGNAHVSQRYDLSFCCDRSRRWHSLVRDLT